MAVAVVALLVALGGTALAGPVASVFTKSDGKRIVKVLPRNSLTGVQIRESRLRLPKPPVATRADTAGFADSAGAAQTAARAADADKLGGRDVTQFAQATELKFAVVGADGALLRQRGGATAAAIVVPAEHTYRVTFSTDVSSCSFTAAPTGSTSTETLAVEISANPNNVRVDADGPTAFHLQLIC
jgi:hypothetical protein